MRLTILAAAAALLCAGCQSGSTADMPTEPSEAMDRILNPTQDPTFLQRMTDFRTPGPPHAQLARSEGRWNVNCRIHVGPSSPPLVMQATADVRMVLGGRYTLEEFRGEILGEPFEAIHLIGFDNLAQDYFSVWLDTWGTGLTIARGGRAHDGAIELAGVEKDPMTPEGRAFRYRFWWRAKVLNVELLDTLPDGTERLVMSMQYSR